MKINIQKYTPDKYKDWNSFVQSASDATFLFHRDFMDYHKERFEDYSLMIYKEDVLIAILPAHIQNKSFYSHRGLSYGYPVVTSGFENAVYDALYKYLKDIAFAKAEFHPAPSFYHENHQHFIEWLEQNNFKINRFLNNVCIDLKKELQPSPKKTAGYRNGKFQDLKIEKVDSFKSFWEEVLIPSLQERHGVKPVHSFQEINLLASHFPENILQYNVYEHGELLAGITFFIKGKIIKSQYAASTSKGMKTDAVGYLYMEAMKIFKEKGFLFMDLGPVNESDGSINEGLLRFKKQLGGSVEKLPRFEINWK